MYFLRTHISHHYHIRRQGHAPYPFTDSCCDSKPIVSSRTILDRHSSFQVCPIRSYVRLAGRSAYCDLIRRFIQLGRALPLARSGMRVVVVAVPIRCTVGGPTMRGARVTHPSWGWVVGVHATPPGIDVAVTATAPSSIHPT